MEKSRGCANRVISNQLIAPTPSSQSACSTKLPGPKKRTPRRRQASVTNRVAVTQRMPRNASRCRKTRMARPIASRILRPCESLPRVSVTMLAMASSARRMNQRCLAITQYIPFGRERATRWAESSSQPSGTGQVLAVWGKRTVRPDCAGPER